MPEVKATLVKEYEVFLRGKENVIVHADDYDHNDLSEYVHNVKLASEYAMKMVLDEFEKQALSGWQEDGESE